MPERAARKPARPSTTAKKPRASADPLPKLREVCLGLPEATEKEAWGSPTFRVKDKLFAMYVNDHHGDGVIAVWCKAPIGFQEILIEADPKRFFRPPYVGHKGWIGVNLDGKVDWKEIAGLLQDAWRMTAPDKLVAKVDGTDEKRSEARAPVARSRARAQPAASPRKKRASTRS